MRPSKLGRSDQEGEPETWLKPSWWTNRRTCVPMYMSAPPPHTTIRDGRRWACSLVLICAVRGRLEPHLECSLPTLQDQTRLHEPQETFWSRPVLYLLAIQRIHQTPPSCTPSCAWRREKWHFRSPQNPYWSKQVGTLWTAIAHEGNDISGIWYPG